MLDVRNARRRSWIWGIWSTYSNENQESNTNKIVKKCRWDSKYSESYLKNLDRQKIDNIQNYLDNINTLDTKNEDISEIINQISEIFTTTKEKTFNKNGNKLIPKNKWYDFQIEKAKKDFKKARTSKIKKNVQTSGRLYKNLLKSKEKRIFQKLRH